MAMALNAEKIVTRVLKVAALPAVALKFSEAIKDPLTSNNDLEKIVSEDSALASKVLMIANSALFNFPSKIDTISNAITIIGHKQLSEVILSCSVVGMFKGIPQDIINMDDFWRHSIAVATTSRILASARREQNIEKFFTAGLLHDIGKLIIFVEAGKQAAQVLSKIDESNELMHKVEKEILGFDHAKLGALLLKNGSFLMRLFQRFTIIICHLFHQQILFLQVLFILPILLLMPLSSVLAGKSLYQY